LRSSLLLTELALGACVAPALRATDGIDRIAVFVPRSAVVRVDLVDE